MTDPRIEAAVATLEGQGFVRDGDIWRGKWYDATITTRPGLTRGEIAMVCGLPPPELDADVSDSLIISYRKNDAW